MVSLIIRTKVREMQSLRALSFILLMPVVLLFCSKDTSTSPEEINPEFSLLFPTEDQEGMHPGFEFQWSKSPAAISYTLQVFNDDDIFTQPNINSLSYVLKSLKYDVEYSWKVSAIDKDGIVFTTQSQKFKTKRNWFRWPDLEGGEEGICAPMWNDKGFVRVYLPPDYEMTDKRYPVVYLQDGRLVFEGLPGVPGSFGNQNGLAANYTLNEFYQESGFGMIVIGVGTGDRFNFYAPWECEGKYDPSYAGLGGKGDIYVDFIAETLKPLIDENFRTLSDATNTGIGGYSLGGLISFYGLMKYPDVFSRGIILSPSFWFTDDKIFDMTIDRVDMLDENKIYFWGGSKEAWGNIDLVGDVDKMVTILENYGFNNHKYFRENGGNHALKYWSLAFPEAIKWLFIE